MPSRSYAAHVAATTCTLEKLLENIDVLFERQPHDKLELEDRAHFEYYLEEQFKHKATVFRDTDKNILDNLEDEHEFEATIIESEEMQSTLSQRIAIITHKLTAVPQQRAGDHREGNSGAPPQPPLAKSDLSASPHNSKAAHREGSKKPLKPARQEPGDTHPPLGMSHDYLNWKYLSMVVIPVLAAFWDCFESAIHLNPNLSGVQKLSYLIAQLKGEAARVITGLPLTNSNYEHSVDLRKGIMGNQTN